MSASSSTPPKLKDDSPTARDLSSKVKKESEINKEIVDFIRKERLGKIEDLSPEVVEEMDKMKELLGERIALIDIQKELKAKRDALKAQLEHAKDKEVSDGFLNFCSIVCFLCIIGLYYVSDLLTGIPYVHYLCSFVIKFLVLLYLIERKNDLTYGYAQIFVYFVIFVALSRKVYAAEQATRYVKEEPTFRWFVVFVALFKMVEYLWNLPFMRRLVEGSVKVIMDRIENKFKKKDDATYRAAYEAAKAFGNTQYAESSSELIESAKRREFLHILAQLAILSQKNGMKFRQYTAAPIVFVLLFVKCNFALAVMLGMFDYVSLYYSIVGHVRGYLDSDCEETECDSIYGDVSDTSTICSFPLNQVSWEQQIDVTGVPLTFVDGIQKPTWTDCLLGSSSVNSGLSFLVMMWTGPRYSTSPCKAVAHYVVAVRNLLCDLKRLHGEEWNNITSAIYEMFPLNKAEGGDEPSNYKWCESVVSGIENIAQFSKTPISKIIDDFITFSLSLPFLFSGLASGASYREVWMLLKKTTGNIGWSLSSILKNFMQIHSRVQLAEGTNAGMELFKSLFHVDSDIEEYLNARNKFMEIEGGIAKIGGVELEEFATHVKKIYAKWKKRAALSGKSVDISRANEVCDLLISVTALRSRSGSKMVPFVLSVDGPPGCGKTTTLESWYHLMHEWIGIRDCMQISTYSASEEFDNNTTNSTTLIKCDDVGNIQPQRRKRDFSAFILQAVQSVMMSIPKADLKEKGAHFYQPYFLVNVDNETERGISAELRTPQAGYRRLGTIISCRAKESHLDEYGRLQSEKCGDFGEHMLYDVMVPVAENLRADSTQPFETILKDLGHKEVLHYLHDRIIEHFEKEKKRLARESVLMSKTLCPKCGILPYSDCDCGVTDFFDAASCSQESLSFSTQSSASAEDYNTHDGSSMGVVPVPQAVAVDSRAEAGFDFLPTLNFQTIPTVGLVSWLVRRASVWVQIRGRTSRMRPLVRVLEGNALETILVALVSIIMASFFVTLLDSDFKDWSQVLKVVAHAMMLGILMTTTYVFRKFKREMRAMIWASDQRIMEIAGSFDSGLTRTIQMCALLGTGYVLNGIVQKIFGEETEPGVAEGSPETDIQSVDSALYQGGIKHNTNIKDLNFPKNAKYAFWAAPPSKSPEAPSVCGTTTVNQLALKIQKNLFEFDLLLKGRKINSGKILFYHSTRALISMHYLLTGVEGTTFTLLPSFEMRIKTSHRGDMVIRLTHNDYAVLKDQDAAVIAFETPIVGMLVSLQEYFPTDVGYGVQSMRRVNCGGTVSLSIRGELEEKPEFYQVVHVGTKEGLEEVRSQLQIKLDTTLISTGGGLCGTPYIRDSTPRCIMGIHSAGSVHKTHCSAAVVTFQMLRDVENVFAEKGRTRVLFPTKVEYKSPLKNVILKREELPDDHPIKYIKDISNVEVIGSIQKDQKYHTMIKPCPLSPLAVEHLGLNPQAAIPRLRWKKTIGGVLENVSKPRGPVDSEMVDKAFSMMSMDFTIAFEKVKDDLPQFVRLDGPLSISEVLNGIPGTCIDRPDLSKASGCGGKKRDYVITYGEGNEMYSQFKPAMMRDIYACLKELKDGRESGTMSYAVLKDEQQKIKEDGERKDARAFYCSSHIFHWISAMYIKPLMQVVALKPHLFETAIGLNRGGDDWFDMMAQFAAEEFRGNCFDIDYKSYDVTQVPAFRSAARKLWVTIARNLSWSKHDIMVLEQILAALHAPTVDFCGVVAKTMFLMISGCIDTAHVNGWFTGIAFRCYVVSRVEEEGRDQKFISEFKKHFLLTTLGDDFLGSMSGEARNAGFSPVEFIGFMDKHGMTLTAADKNEKPDFKDFDKTEFLKSEICYNEAMRRNVGVVGPTSYLKSFFAHEPRSDLPEYLHGLLHSVLLEAALGGELSFNEMKTRCEKFCSAGNVPLPKPGALTYKEVVEEYFGDGKQEPLTENRNVGMKKLEEYGKLESKCEADTSPDDSGGKEELVAFDEPPEEVEADPFPAMEKVTTEFSTAFTEFLERRVNLGAFIWKTTNDTSAFFLNPWDALMGNKLMRSKLEHVAGFKCEGIELTAELVCPASQSGCLLMSVTHYPDTLINPLNSAADVALHSQRENVEIRPSADSTVFRIMVPFATPHVMLPPTKEGVSQLPHLRIHVISPLISSSGALVPVTVQLYGKFIGMQTSGATALSSPGILNFSEGDNATVITRESEATDAAVCPSREMGSPAQVAALNPPRKTTFERMEEIFPNYCIPLSKNQRVPFSPSDGDFLALMEVFLVYRESTTAEMLPGDEVERYHEKFMKMFPEFMVYRTRRFLDFEKYVAMYVLFSHIWLISEFPMIRKYVEKADDEFDPFTTMHHHAEGYCYDRVFPLTWRSSLRLILGQFVDSYVMSRFLRGQDLIPHANEARTTWNHKCGELRNSWARDYITPVAITMYVTTVAGTREHVYSAKFLEDYKVRKDEGEGAQQLVMHCYWDGDIPKLYAVGSLEAVNVLKLNEAIAHSQGIPFKIGAEKVSNVLSKVSSAGSILSGIPGLSFLATPSEIIKKAGSALHMAGWSKPVVPRDPHVGAYSMNGSGNVQAAVAAVCPKQEVAAIAELDAMGIEELCNRWTLIDRVNFSSVAESGTTLATYMVTPNIHVPDGNGQYQPAACALPIMFFGYHNVEMEYMVKCDLPKFTSGKIAITYDPLPPLHPNLGGSVELRDEYMQTRIVDLVKKDSITIKVGHHRYKGGLRTWIADANGEVDETSLLAWRNPNYGSLNHHNGSLALSVQHKLVAASGIDITGVVRIYARAKNVHVWGYLGGLPRPLTGSLPPGVDSPEVAPRPGPTSDTKTICGDNDAEICEPVGGPISYPVPRYPDDTNWDEHEESKPRAPGTGDWPTKPPDVPPATGAPSTAPIITPPSVAPNSSAPTTGSPTGGALEVKAWTTQIIPGFFKISSPSGLADVDLRFEGPKNFETVPHPSVGTSYTIDIYSVNNGDPTADIGITHKVEDGAFTSDLGPVPPAPYVQESVTVTPPNARIYTYPMNYTGSGEMRIRGTTTPIPTGWAYETRILGSSLQNYHNVAEGLPQNSTWIGVPSYGGIIMSCFHPQTTDELIPLWWEKSLYDSGAHYQELIDCGFTTLPVQFIVHGQISVYLDSTKIETLHSSDGNFRCVIVEVPIFKFLLGESADDRGNGPVCVQLGPNSTPYRSSVHFYRTFMRATKDSEGSEWWDPPASGYTYPTRRLLQKLMMSEGFHDPVAEEDDYFECGGSPVSSEDIARLYAGEQVVSMREVLKIPQLIYQHEVNNHESNKRISYLYGVGEDFFSAYWIMLLSFAYVRGGMVSSYVLLGEGSVEVTRKTDRISLQRPELAGVAFANNYTNPYLSVKVPFQYGILFDWAQGIAGGSRIERILTMWGVNGLKVREFRSTAEDFTLLQFRGAPLLKLS